MRRLGMAAAALLLRAVLHVSMVGPCHSRAALLPYRSYAGRIVGITMDATRDESAGSPATKPVRTTEMQAVLDELALRQRRNVLLAVGSVVAASGLYTVQRLNPADPVKLLRRMEAQSPPLESALKNGKPTVVEFYAPWCESCKLGARDMLKLERRYGGQINFVTLNGDDPRNARMVSLFGVDSIPHIALLTSERALRNTLVGAVPTPILEREIVKLIPS